MAFRQPAPNHAETAGVPVRQPPGVTAMFYQPRSPWQILLKGLRVYGRHWVCLTQPIVLPVIAQIAGIVLWLVLVFGTMAYFKAAFPQLPVWVTWLVFVLSNIPGIVIHLKGVWDYLLWLPATNLGVRNLMETGQFGDKTAYLMRVTCRSPDYSLALTFLFALLFLPLGFAMIPLALTAANPKLLLLGVLCSVGMLLLGMLVATVLLIFTSLVFQVFVFAPGSAGACLFRSADLVKRGFFKTLVVGVVAFSVTQCVLPTVVVWLGDITQAIPWTAYYLERPLQWILQQAVAPQMGVGNPMPAFMTDFLKTQLQNPHFIALVFTKSFICTTVGVLLVPLGTCWFALLYGDLKQREDDRLAAIQAAPVPEVVPTA